LLSERKAVTREPSYLTPIHLMNSLNPKRKSTVALWALLGLLPFLASCATQYTITLNSGARVTAQDKPKRVGNNYVFKDALGKPAQISAFRVVQIERSSGASKEPFSSIPSGTR
jgi:hypothetical protein